VKFRLKPASFRSLSKVHNFKGHTVNRVALISVLFLAFGWIGVGLTAGQGAPQAPPRVPARSTSSVSASTSKVVRIYSGAGYFDAQLAEKLRPVLAKAFGAPQVVGEAPAPKSGPDVLRSILGRGAPENAGRQRKLAKSDQP
jgi:hypothetical protein